MSVSAAVEMMRENLKIFTTATGVFQILHTETKYLLYPVPVPDEKSKLAVFSVRVRAGGVALPPPRPPSGAFRCAKKDNGMLEYCTVRASIE